jgi:hypothetical protein
MRPTQLLETNLADVLIAELLGPAKRPPQSDDRFPVIEILPAFDAAVTSKFQRGAVIDADDTLPHALYSSPYERVDVVPTAAEPVRSEPYARLRTRKRAATISRSVLAQRREAPVASTVTSGSFEAAWFVAPDDAVDHAEPAAVERSRWPLIGAAAIAAAAMAAIALVLLA